MTDFIIIVILFVIIGAAVIYIKKSKKKGINCIGCPHSGNCGTKGQNVSCSCNCGSKY